MNKYEELLDDAVAADIDVDEDFPLQGRMLGVYMDNHIALSNRLKTSAEKASILAEELGHHYTSFGNILDPSDLGNRKQEHQTRMWSYKRLLSLQHLVDVYLHGYHQFHEVAEYLEVTEEFLRDAVEGYRSKYGVYTTCGDYYIIFEPYLTIGKHLPTEMHELDD